MQRHKKEADTLKELFTPAQLSRVLDYKRVPWGKDDISRNMSLYSSGPKAYKILHNLGNPPLPSPRTLRRKAMGVNLMPGFLEPVLGLLKDKEGDDMSKICTFAFDDMKVKREFANHLKMDKFLLPSDYAFMVMAKGLCAKWQQVVYYSFDTNPTPDLVHFIVEKLEGCGLIPVAVVSDLGPHNRVLWEKMKITIDKPYFEKKNGDPVFVFADMPHMVKLLRNHFLDTGFDYKDQKFRVRPVRRLLNAQQVDVRIAHKLSAQHFPGKRNSMRQNVRLAVQLLSNSVQAGIRALKAVLEKRPNC